MESLKCPFLIGTGGVESGDDSSPLLLLLLRVVGSSYFENRSSFSRNL